MHKSLLIVLILGLSASIRALDLSHAAQPETKEVDPRIFNFIQDFYAQVVHPPLNHIVTNLALLGAQVLAGVSVTGIPAPGGRSVQLTEAELRGFWDGLWNTAIRPPIENAISGISLMAAQVLAGIGINGVDLTLGKRDLTAEDARILDALSQAFQQVFTNVIQEPLQNAISGGALMLAQVLAGIGVNGVDLSNLGGLFGKRELTAEDARIIDALTAAFQNVFTNVIQEPLQNAISGGALMLAQVLAGIGVNGVDLSNLGGLFGKRELNANEAAIRGILDTVGSTVVTGLQSVWNSIFAVPLGNFIQNGALAGAQVLAGLGTNGVNLGKRSTDARAAIIDGLLEHASGLYVNQVKPVVENALNNVALQLAAMLANFSQTGFGRR